MARARGGINPLRRNILNSQRFAAAKEIANACNRYSIKIKLVSPQSRSVQVKDRQRNVLREMTVQYICKNVRDKDINYM